MTRCLHLITSSHVSYLIQISRNMIQRQLVRAGLSIFSVLYLYCSYLLVDEELGAAAKAIYQAVLRRCRSRRNPLSFLKEEVSSDHGISYLASSSQRGDTSLLLGTTNGSAFSSSNSPEHTSSQQYEWIKNGHAKLTRSARLCSSTRSTASLSPRCM